MSKKEKSPISLDSFRCTSKGCKTKANRFGFCDEHYSQFKFGLITKTGEPVPDYDKKLSHYNAYKEKQSARKVA